MLPPKPMSNFTRVRRSEAEHREKRERSEAESREKRERGEAEIRE